MLLNQGIDSGIDSKNNCEYKTSVSICLLHASNEDSITPGIWRRVTGVGAKEKELVGNYRNNGADWRPAGDPKSVKVHDFIDPELGKANR